LNLAGNLLCHSATQAEQRRPFGKREILNAPLAMAPATVLAAAELTQAWLLKVARSLVCLGDLAKLRRSLVCLGDLAKLRRQWQSILKLQLTQL